MRTYLLVVSLMLIAAGPLAAQCDVANDVNGDGVFDASDPKALLDYLFLGGPRPACLNQADANGDGNVDIADAVTLLDLVACNEAIVGDVNGTGILVMEDVDYLLEYLFLGGPEPVPCPEVADVNDDGQLTIADAVALFDILPCPPDVVGNANGDESLAPNIADMLVVAQSFVGGPGPVPCPLAGDLNGDGKFDIADLIAYAELF